MWSAAQRVRETTKYALGKKLSLDILLSSQNMFKFYFKLLDSGQSAQRQGNRCIMLADGSEVIIKCNLWLDCSLFSGCTMHHGDADACNRKRNEMREDKANTA